MSAQTYDNTILSTFADCEEKYRLFLLDGLAPTESGPAPAFGTAIHEAREVQRKALVAGQSHEQAVAEAVKRFHEAWDREMPLYMKDIAKADDRRGKVNGEKLLRGYFGKYQGHIYKPVYLEIPFALHLGRTPKGREVVYSGIIDEVCEFNGGLYVLDLKTTSDFPSPWYFQKWKTNRAFKGYMAAVEEVTGQVVDGILVHAIYVSTHGKFSKKPFSDYFQEYCYAFTDEQIEEWKRDTLDLVDDVEGKKESGRFVHNFGTACTNFGGCAYKALCDVGPAERALVAKTQYKRVAWDPLAKERLRDV